MVNLLGLVIAHPITYGYMRDRASQLLASLAGQVDPAELAAATERGRARPLLDAVAALAQENGP